MLVRNWMTQNVFTVDEETPMVEAAQLMRDKNVGRLPVLSKDGKLVGIVTDLDIKAASPSKATSLDVHEMYYLLSKVKIKEVMTKRPITIDPDKAVDQAAVVMLEKDISGMPVVDDQGLLVGILTKKDVFRCLTSLTGVYEGGLQLAFELDDRSGSIKEVADVIRAHGGGMTSILTSYETASGGKRNVFFRVRGISEDNLQPLLDEVRAKFNLLYYGKVSK